MYMSYELRGLLFPKCSRNDLKNKIIVKKYPVPVILYFVRMVEKKTVYSVDNIISR